MRRQPPQRQKADSQDQAIIRSDALSPWVQAMIEARKEAGAGQRKGSLNIKEPLRLQR